MNAGTVLPMALLGRAIAGLALLRRRAAAAG
jgi:hypothetical protein